MQTQTVGQAALCHMILSERRTGKEIGRKFGLDEATVSRMKNGRQPIPDDILGRLLRETGDPRFLIDHLTEKRLLPVNMPRPRDLNESLLAATIRVAREMGESADCCRSLTERLADIPDDGVLGIQDTERLIAAGVEIIEGIMAGLCWYASLSDRAPDLLSEMERRVQNHKRAG